MKKIKLSNLPIMQTKIPINPMKLVNVRLLDCFLFYSAC